MVVEVSRIRTGSTGVQAINRSTEFSTVKVMLIRSFGLWEYFKASQLALKIAEGEE